ncbi:MAG: putative sulfate exporter family transporter [Polyangiaceae bacterium]|nr:putative sulfate exporter family transporter [Polyangiaceae bacterium]
MLPRVVFLALLAFTAILSPPLALALGIAFGMLSPHHPYAAASRKWSKQLLQISVVALGFAMNLQEVLRAGKSGFVYTLLGITFALVLGSLLGRLFGVPKKAAYLISVGTAICGGSAIAAVGPVVDANDEEMSVSIGTVFLLNAVGLLVFPPLGHLLGLTESQFGLWAALAIHDTSSVVGAGAKYGTMALTVATTVKLARALWIVPLAVGTAAILARHNNGANSSAKKKIAWPWFILFFLGAAILSTYVTFASPIYAWLAKAGRVGLTITLFLIGTGMSRASLKKVGLHPLVHGVVLWIAIASCSIALIRSGLIGF